MLGAELPYTNNKNVNLGDLISLKRIFPYSLKFKLIFYFKNQVGGKNENV